MVTVVVCSSWQANRSICLSLCIFENFIYTACLFMPKCGNKSQQIMSLKIWIFKDMIPVLYVDMDNPVLQWRDQRKKKQIKRVHICSEGLIVNFRLSSKKELDLWCEYQEWKPTNVTRDILVRICRVSFLFQEKLFFYA